MKLNVLLFSKTTLQLVLFFLFLTFFGIPSFNKYQKKETIVVKSELETEGIEVPAVTLQATLDNFLGWKSAKEDTTWTSFELFEHCKGINKTIDECVQTDTIKLSDFLAEAKFENMFNLSASVQIDLSSSSPDWTEDMTATGLGKYFTIRLSKPFVPNEDHCLIFSLLKNFTFLIFVHDENFFFYNSNPLGPPINYQTFQGPLEKNHYQELTLTKQTKLNLDRQPCEDNPAYSFNSCIKETLSKQVSAASRTKQ